MSDRKPANENDEQPEREHIERCREVAKALRLKLRPVPPARGVKPRSNKT